MSSRIEEAFVGSSLRVSAPSHGRAAAQLLLRATALAGILVRLDPGAVALAAEPADGPSSAHDGEEEPRTFTVADFERFGVRIATARAGLVDAAIEQRTGRLAPAPEVRP